MCPRCLPRLMTAVLCLLGTVAVQPALAQAGGDHRVRLTVSATVLPRTRLQVSSAPESLVVTEADLSRGYVDVPTPLALSVWSNVAPGARLVFSTVSDYIVQANVEGLAQPLVLGPGTGSVVVPREGARAGTTDLQLRFRVYLARNTPTGVHPWPIRVTTG